MTVETRIGALDVSLFDTVETQTELADRRSLLALYGAWRTVYESFAYLEIGSHIGGSLQVLLQDPACTSVTSIDSRPTEQPDMRGATWRYAENSTARMLAELSRVPGADLEKLETIDASTADLSPADIAPRPDVCFVDGEHTDDAALRDAQFCRRAIGGAGCIVFHDAQLVYSAIRHFLDELRDEEVEHRSYFLPSSIFVVEIGPARLTESGSFVAMILENADGYLWSLIQNDPFRSWYLKSLRRRFRLIKARLRRR